jgi:hypothetical protein
VNTHIFAQTLTFIRHIMSQQYPNNKICNSLFYFNQIVIIKFCNLKKVQNGVREESD